MLRTGSMQETLWDVIVIGGGPAGLSAALTLGRCRRRVLVCDTGLYRNRASRHMHSFLSRDGIPPKEFLQICREQLKPYDCVSLRSATVADATRDGDEFEVVLEDGTHERSRTLLLATGVADEVPKLPGIEQFYGCSVHHCPYCDGWEWRDQTISVYGHGDKGAELALMLKQWTAHVVLLTNAEGSESEEMRGRLGKHGIQIREARIARLEGRDAFLERIVFEDGSALECKALFFSTGQHQRSPLATRLGCEFTSKGGVEAYDYEVATNVPGLYVAGDASRDVQLVIVAAAEGTKAAFAINKALLARDGLG